MRLIIISLLAILSLSTYAGSRSAESVAQKIVSSSPKLKTLKAVSDAENAKNMTEANLPDPEIEGEYLVAPAGEQDRWGAGISWGLDWPGVYSARKGVAKAQSELNLRKIKNEEYGLAVSTRRILLDYILQTSQIETLRNILLTTDSICLLATKSRNGGEMTQLDLNKIQLETASLNARLTSLLDSRMQSVAELSQIAGYDCTPLLSEMKIEFPEVNPLNEDDIERMIISSYPMEEAKAAIRLAEEEKRVTSREKLPGISFGYRHAFEDGNHFNGGSLGLSLPLFSSKGKTKAAEVSRKAAEIAAEETALNSKNEAFAALKRKMILDKEISEIAPLLENTDNQTLLLKAYKGGVITLIEYLNERNYYLEASMQLLELRHAASVQNLELIKLTNFNLQ